MNRNRFGLLLRKSRNGTQSELVKQLSKIRGAGKIKKLEITKAMLSHFETGRYTPGLEYAPVFAKALDLPLEDIITAIISDEVDGKCLDEKLNIIAMQIHDGIEQIALKRNSSLFIHFQPNPTQGIDEKGRILKYDPPAGDIIFHWLDLPRKKGDPLIDFWQERKSYFASDRKTVDLVPHFEGDKLTRFQKKKGMKNKIIGGKVFRKYDWIFYDEYGVRLYSNEEKEASALIGKPFKDAADKYREDYFDINHRIREYVEKIPKVETSEKELLNRISDLTPEPDQIKPINAHTSQFKHIFYRLLKVELSDPNSKARFLKEIALNQIIFPELRRIVQRKLDKNTFRRLCYVDDKISFDTLKQLMQITCQYVDKIGDRF